ncbi:MAG: restriction endonuclease subunit S, partial [Enterococcus sp.]|nr:restriction endonuclease subunit S [Enterococcus sp.]
TAEDISVASVVAEKGVLLGGDLNIVKPTEFLNSTFLAISISNGKPHDDMAKMAQGKSVVHLHNSDLEKINLIYPKATEQKQLDDFFSNLDSLLTLRKKQLEKLQNFKRSCLEKMFPKNGCSVPELRFDGFEGEWEKRNVSELLMERNEQSPASAAYPLMAFIANEGVAPKGERYDRSSLVNDVEKKLYKRTEFGDFIYSSNNLETGSIGINKYGNATISPVYSIFKPTSIADSDFIGRRLVRKDFINEMIKWRQGVIYGQWRIHESDFLKIEIRVPSVEEQRKIGIFLDKLDDLLKFEQVELGKLENLKKAYLEKMFV